jgi:hypothetical protein
MLYGLGIGQPGASGLEATMSSSLRFTLAVVLCLSTGLVASCGQVPTLTAVPLLPTDTPVPTATAKP